MFTDFVVVQPSKPWAYYLEWTQRLMFEFYAQGDRERELGIPVTPMLDRTKPIPLPKFQVWVMSRVSDVIQLLSFDTELAWPLATPIASGPMDHLYVLFHHVYQAGFINAIVLPLYKELNRVDGVSIPVPCKSSRESIGGFFQFSCWHIPRATFAVAQLESNLAAWNQQMLADAAPPPPPA